MSENKGLEQAWHACIERVVAEIADYSSSWTPHGRNYADAISNKVKTMPVPARVEK
jgi:hypothetical protein